MDHRFAAGPPLSFAGTVWKRNTEGGCREPLRRSRQTWPGRPHGHGELSPAEAAAQIRFLEEEVALLRRKITESPRHVRILEQRLAESAGRLAQLSARNEKLTETLKEARGQLVALREEVDRLAQPPSGYGVFLARFPDETVDVFTSGRRMRVAVSPGRRDRRAAAAARPSASTRR